MWYNVKRGDFMGLFNRKSKKEEPIKKIKKDEEVGLSVETLNHATGGIPLGRAWCPKVDIDMRNIEDFNNKDTEKDTEHEIEDR